jgi:hypothetical protein
VYRKDVECAFGVLQAQYAIIQYPRRLWQHSDLSFIMKIVKILHNMTIEDEQGSDFENDYKYHQIQQTQTEVTTPESANSNFDAFLLRDQSLRNIYAHKSLKNDLIKHLWAKHGKDGNEA